MGAVGLAEYVYTYSLLNFLHRKIQILFPKTLIRNSLLHPPVCVTSVQLAVHVAVLKASSHELGTQVAAAWWVRPDPTHHQLNHVGDAMNFSPIYDFF